MAWGSASGRCGLVGFFGDYLGAEGFAEEVRVAAGVLFQDDVVLADGLGFFLGGEGSFVHWCGGGAAALFGGNGGFSGPAFAGGLFAAGLGDLGRCRRRRRSTGLLIGLQRSRYCGFCAGRAAVRSRSILYCDRRVRCVPRGAGMGRSTVTWRSCGIGRVARRGSRLVRRRAW
jgi:hypothetical protein